MIDGYPEPEDLEYLKEALNAVPSDFQKGAKALGDLIEGTHYGKARMDAAAKRLEIATGGWSGCEEILGEARCTLWWAMYWQSVHRGGLYVFEWGAL